jgi:hypothetical protein
MGLMQLDFKNCKIKLPINCFDTILNY